MRWRATGRPKQQAPEQDWDTWGIMTGRGFGKTLSGAHWLGIEAASNPKTFWCCIAPTQNDVRYVNFEGPTGIITVMPPKLIVDYNKSDLLIYLWNGSVIRGFGSEKPDRLRGPQHHGAWTDEVAAWEYAEETWDMMEFGLRLGDRPRIMWTTTPKPVEIIRTLVKNCKKDPARHVLIQGSTDENRENLNKKYYERVARYRGTKIGRQELEGELIDPEESGIVKRSQWRVWPHDKPLPVFQHIVYSLDTAYTAQTFDPKKKEPDPSAMTLWGMFMNKKIYNVMMLDCWQDWLPFPELVERVREDMLKTYGEIDKPVLQRTVIPSRWTQNPVATGHPIDVMLIEDKGSGISLRQTLAMENIFMEPYNPGRADKLSRLHTITPMFAHGRVWAIESESRAKQPKDWMDPPITQVCTYHGPGTTAHDDYLDTTTQALRYFMNKFIFTFVSQESEEERLQMLQEEERFRSEPVSNPYNQ